jgi:predicted dehydrogenase/threonine dehydrogenase-like Zn-dependent dehydrogenase
MPLQVSQNYRTGKVALSEVGVPALRSGGVIVRTAFSVVSPGTEGTKLKEAKLSLIDKARARPDQVKQVMDVVRQQGLRAAYQKVLNRLEQLTPLGYSISGQVVAVADDVEEFSIGDRVAAGGAGFASHAEYNFIPRNLVVPVPETVKAEHAAFTTIGSIAMHAYRQSNVRLGETALVIGLGLVGQLLSQILSAAGVTVIGLDLDQERCSLASASGAASAAKPGDASWKAALGEHGADAVFIAAGSADNSLLELAASHVRDRGTIVVVGKTALDLDYNTFFKKEIEVRFSRSYGPGRFDPAYEIKGVDYPLAYVRWTERRNMKAFVDLLARGRLNLSPLLNVMRPFDAAVETYDQLYRRQIDAIGVVFDYGTEAAQPVATIAASAPAISTAGLRIGVIGAGNYAASMILPELKGDRRVELAHVVTNNGLSAAGIAERFQIPSHGTDANAVFADPSIQAVVIATRHSSHAALVAQALTAGKAVFVEKPLAIDETGLALVRKAWRPASRLMVGFNRRFSPIMQRLAVLCHGCGPMHMVYRVQAGSLPADAWQCQPEEGGRFIGEAGHFLDVFQFLINSQPSKVLAARLNPASSTRDHDSNVSATIAYGDGSVATLIYSTLGGARLPKEYFEVHCGGQSLVMKNFESLDISSGQSKSSIDKGFSGKGQKEQMQAFLAALLGGSAMPVAFDDLAATAKLTLDVARAAREDGAISWHA